MSLVPNEPINIDCPSFQPAHRLQACTKNLPNMKSFVYNQLSTKTLVELKDNSNLLSVLDAP